MNNYCICDKRAIPYLGDKRYYRSAYKEDVYYTLKNSTAILVKLTGEELTLLALLDHIIAVDNFTIISEACHIKARVNEELTTWYFDYITE